MIASAVPEWCVAPWPWEMTAAHAVERSRGCSGKSPGAAPADEAGMRAKTTARPTAIGRCMRTPSSRMVGISPWKEPPTLGRQVQALFNQLRRAGDPSSLRPREHADDLDLPLGGHGGLGN